MIRAEIAGKNTRTGAFRSLVKIQTDFGGLRFIPDALNRPALFRPIAL